MSTSAPSSSSTGSSPAPANAAAGRGRLTPGRLAAGAALLVGALALIAAARGARAERTPDPAGTVVETLVARAVTGVVTTRGYTGRLRPARAADLGFNVPGQLVEVVVSEGAHVSSGQVLARLDLRSLDARLAQATASLQGAVAQLDELRAGPRSETIAAAKARLVAAGAQLRLLRAKERRRAKLLEANVITQEELQEFTESRKAQAAQVDVVARQLDELCAGTRPEQLRAGEARVRASCAQVAQLTVEREDRTLRAPYAGFVGALSARRGAVLQPGQAVLRLVEDAPLEAWVGVPPQHCGPLTPGSLQWLLCDGVRYPARVHALLPELDSVTRTRTVVLRLVPPPRSDEPVAQPPVAQPPVAQPPVAQPPVAEQIVRLVIADRRALAGVWVPLDALSEGERKVWSCFVVAESDEGRGSVARRAVVRVVHTEPDRVLVTGLEDGELVVASGAHRLVAGQSVRAGARR